MIGADGKAPSEFEVNLPASSGKPLTASDEFDYAEDRLALNWQWNHNPDPARWSVTKRPGHLRLETGKVAGGVLCARNTLTQRTEGPTCEAVVGMDVSGMLPGDHGGMIALQSNFGTVGIRVAENGDRYVVMCVNRGDGKEDIVERVLFSGDFVYLKITFDFRNSADKARFFHSTDGNSWMPIGRTLHMKYTLDHFMGYRIGLFAYASIRTGGFADFDFFRFAKT